MSKRNKLRPITDWYIRTVGEHQVLIGWEIYADRPILDTVQSRSFEIWKDQKRPCYKCARRRYLAVGPAAPTKMWRMKNAPPIA